MVSQLFVRSKLCTTILTMMMINVALMQRFWGYAKMGSNVLKIAIPTAEIIVLGTLYIFITQSL